MSDRFHHKLDTLRRELLAMGALVDEQLRRATHALLECDRAKAQHAIALDCDVDACELRVDEMCVRLIALHQPAAGDLRFIVAAMKVVTDLERAGDQAVGIARGVLDACGGLPETGFARMSGLARSQLAASLDALRRGDAEAARAVIADDAALDELEKQIMRRLLAQAMREPSRLRFVYPLAYATRCLERVGDHAANVAGMALYSVEGVIEHPRLSASRAAGAPRPLRLAAQGR
jgi:phosphate transport system protein